MDVHAAMRDDRTLRRIIALLVALAALAERASARSLPVRWFVVWLLRRAETAAADYVFEATGVPPYIDGSGAVDDGPADALGLAARFRALAAMLAALLSDLVWLDRWPAPRGRMSGHGQPDPGSAAGNWSHGRSTRRKGNMARQRTIKIDPSVSFRREMYGERRALA